MFRQPPSPFHDAEVSVQNRLGIAELLAKKIQGFIREAMPNQHREFFCDLPFVVLGLVDQQGFPWAMPLYGKSGFITSPSATRLQFNALPTLRNLLDLDFHEGQKVGMVGVQLHTRRRNRMNGILGNITEQGFTIDVDQSFGNCPQYIQARELEWQSDALVRQDLSDVAINKVVPAETQQFIENADTFFIASRTKEFTHDRRSGIDASHRGGKPGFVKVEDNTLYYPDFSGNKFFNTLGNIESDGRVGLFFPNYTTGDAVFITGTAEIVWDDPAIDEFEGAERLVKIAIHKSVHISQVMPMTGKLLEYSPVLQWTGTWSDLSKTSNHLSQPFKLIDKQKESNSITSFYFSPVDGKNTEPYTPGQFLPISLNISNKEQLNRSYTLSRAPIEGSYRISVKREAQGQVSQLLHDQLQVGDLVELGKPAGQFTLQDNDHAIVLLSGGVGITPMVAMLDGLVRDIAQGAKPRPVWFIHATQNSETLAFHRYINMLKQQYDGLQVYTVFSRPLASDILGQSHQSEGRISIDLLKRILPFDLYDFYLCGSEGFMRAIYPSLIQTGVSKNNIYYEFFGEGSIEDDNQTPAKVAKKATVTFSKAGISGEWTPNDKTLLDFAEKQGLKPMHSCRSGNCGACACKLQSGKIRYDKQPNFEPSDGEVLICCAKPAAGTSEVIIDLG